MFLSNPRCCTFCNMVKEDRMNIMNKPRPLFEWLIILLTLLAASFSACLDPVYAQGWGLMKVRLEVPEKFRKGVFKVERYLNVPEGFSVSVFAAGLDTPRFMAFDRHGRLFVSLPSQGQVVVLPDTDSDGVADRQVVFARGLTRPHGLAFSGDELIVAETGRVIAINLKKEASSLAAGPLRVLSSEIPSGGGHWSRSVVVGADGTLYVSAGSSCNVCVEDDPKRASVMRLREGRAIEIYAMGLRNTVGLAFHHDTGELWGVDNGRDWLGDDLPPEELNLVREGGDYGWPYCYGDRVQDPDYGSPGRCASTKGPAVMMQAHSAPLGISFGDGLGFPAEFKGALYIAFHGSWNRSKATGYKIVAVSFKAGAPAGGPIDFITGWFYGTRPWGRPVAPIVGPDGALYISDDYAGAIYRVVYKGGAAR